jgi:hypothetical protein
VQLLYLDCGVPVRRSSGPALLALALLAGALWSPATGLGAALVAPPDGAKVSSTPTFAWGPAPGEDANQIELSPNPALAPEGPFVDDPRKRSALLDDTQTSYTVPAAQPLLAGTWYWHVEMMDYSLPQCCSNWTAFRRVVVQDEPIRLSSFKVGFLGPLDELVTRFSYVDNSTDLAARYRLVFKKRRHGRRLAAASGKVDRGNLQNGEVFVTARRPKGLRRGRRYLVRLELRDSGGHVARSAYVRLRLR